MEGGRGEEVGGGGLLAIFCAVNSLSWWFGRYMARWSSQPASQSRTALIIVRLLAVFSRFFL